MSTAPIKTCDHCQHTGTMPTFRDGETICIDCMEKSANMSRGKYLALLAEVEQLKKGVELRDQQNADLHDMIADVHQERDQLKTELANLQIEVNNLRGLKPEIPPMPGEDWPRELPRYGLRWNGHNQPTSVPYKDGYWTPWYLANRLHEELEREQAAARTACANWRKVNEERDQLAAQLELERLKANAAGDLEYANGAIRGFEWGQHDDNASLAACIESRAPESVRTLKEIRQQAKEVQS